MSNYRRAAPSVRKHRLLRNQRPVSLDDVRRDFLADRTGDLATTARLELLGYNAAGAAALIERWKLERWNGHGRTG